MKIFILTCACMAALLVLAHFINVLGYPDGLAFVGGMFVGFGIVGLYEAWR